MTLEEKRAAFERLKQEVIELYKSGKMPSELSLEEKIDRVHVNALISNPNVTREMVVRAVLLQVFKKDLPAEEEK